MLCLTFPNGISRAKDQSNKVVQETAREEEPEQSELNRVFQSESQETATDNKGETIIKSAYRKADSNSDGYVTIRELAKYINLKICDHIDTAIKRNPQIFSEIDKNPVDGLISWYVHFDMIGTLV